MNYEKPKIKVLNIKIANAAASISTKIVASSSTST